MRAPKSLQSLVAGLDLTIEGPAADVVIAGLTSDSRAVKPGMLFAALAGSKADGSAFVGQAVANGAAAVLIASNATLMAPTGVTVLRSPEPRLALAKIAAAFYPGQPPIIVAVTGTNGKTSIAEFTRQIWTHLGHKAASLGTIGVVKPGGAVYGSLTTPDPITLHETLQQLHDEGITHLALEASSHGLDQYRLDGVRLTAGAFNNLGRDHLDYHPTVEAYLEAKLQLFKRLLKPGEPAIINVPAGFGLDATASGRAIEVASTRKLRVKIVGSAGADYGVNGTMTDQFSHRSGLQFIHAGQTFTLPSLNLIGEYQVSNALVAAALVIETGGSSSAVFGQLPKLQTVKGRLELVARHNRGIAVIDYAHKPEALEAALSALRPFATGKLICVFGCGGDRDKGKRPIMGRIAADKADVVIVTDDNPRTEVAATVRAEILAACPGAIEIGDRAEAIRAGVAMLGPGDVLLVAGKGHETGQIVGKTVFPFSDHDAITEAIRAL